MGIAKIRELGKSAEMSRKRHIKNVRERTNHWHIFFKSRRRSPQEVIFSFPKKLFSATDVERKRDELYAAYHEGWDPWSRRMPKQQSVTITVVDAVATARTSED